MGKVDFGGVFKRVCLEHVPEVRLGEYVLVHVGFALSQHRRGRGRRVFEFLEGMKQLDELRGALAMNTSTSTATPRPSPASSPRPSPRR